MLKQLTTIAIAVFSTTTYANLPKDRDALGDYANRLNNSTSGHQQTQISMPVHLVSITQDRPAARSGFSTRYLGIQQIKPKEEQHQVTDQASITHANIIQQRQNLNPTQYSAPVIRPVSNTQSQYVQPTVRSVSYTQPQYDHNYDQIIPGRVATLSCVIHAARSEQVPLYVLLGIHSKEYGQNGQTAKNKNSSLDMGQFQINTIHFKKGGMFENYNQNHVRNDGCLNARLAAKILKNRLLTKPSTDFWTRAAAYHSWTPQYNNIYKHGTKKHPGLIAFSNQWKNWLEYKGINPN